uniref:Uncharacterized protein n=1 Tax=Anopheles atroparvus TaxID=41427 RepID=A0A182JLC2_ANOAO
MPSKDSAPLANLFVGDWVVLECNNLTVIVVVATVVVVVEGTPTRAFCAFTPPDDPPFAADSCPFRTPIELSSFSPELMALLHGAVIIASLLPVSDWKNVPKRFRPSRSDMRCAISGVSSCRLVKFSFSTGAFALRMNVIGYFFMWISRTYLMRAGLSWGTPIRS